MDQMPDSPAFLHLRKLSTRHSWAMPDYSMTNGTGLTPATGMPMPDCGSCLPETEEMQMSD
jgi:hypothetical protein